MIILISVHRLSNSPAATLRLAVTRKRHLLHLAHHIILKHLHLAIIQLSPRLKRIQVKCITHHTLGMTSPHIHVGPGRPSAGQQGRYSFKLRLLTGKLLIPRSSHRACGAQLVGKWSLLLRDLPTHKQLLLYRNHHLIIIIIIGNVGDSLQKGKSLGRSQISFQRQNLSFLSCHLTPPSSSS